MEEADNGKNGKKICNPVSTAHGCGCREIVTYTSGKALPIAKNITLDPDRESLSSVTCITSCYFLFEKPSTMHA